MASGSSALTQDLGDLFFCVGSVSGWQESANLSRAFSQFFWDFDLVRETLSKDTAPPAPKPDWDFLILSSICTGGKKEKENKIILLLYTRSKSKKCQQDTSTLPGRISPGFSFQFPLCPVPLLSSSPSFPTSSALYWLHWSPFERTRKRHRNWHLHSSFSPSLAIAVNGIILTHEQKLGRHLFGKHLHCPQSVVETLLGPCI